MIASRYANVVCAPRSRAPEFVFSLILLNLYLKAWRDTTRLIITYGRRQISAGPGAAAESLSRNSSGPLVFSLINVGTSQSYTYNKREYIYIRLKRIRIYYYISYAYIHSAGVDPFSVSFV